MTYYNNKAAVLLEQQKYEDCEKAGKVYNRLASLHMKMKKYDDAKAMYQKSLAEDNNRHTRNALRDSDRLVEKQEADALVDPAKADEHKEKGNAFFKEKKWAEAK